MRRLIVKYKKILAVLLLLLGIGYYFCLPQKLFNDPYSTVLQASTGELLSATIAGDGQWRFPGGDTIPEKFSKALIAFEDKRFRYHPGVDLLSLARAMLQNLRAGKVVSGGSTLTMQVVRLSRQGKPRTVFEKFIEVILATRLEWRYSKDEILALYASHAPFGGNVVGLDAACWRYFGVDPSHLSWGEASLLAVLPNAPSLIHPGKNRALLKAKRNALLDKLRTKGTIDSFTCALAKEESIPGKPLALPRLARHLLGRMSKEGRGETRLTSTIDYDLQQRVEQIVKNHHRQLASNQIFNVAAIVLEVSSGHVLAYVGNSDPGKDHGEAVDVITAPRSTGSILKPFLYAAMLDEGKILPGTLLPDIPTMINGFAPKNFSREYDGAVPANQALIRSLNVPAVYLLRDYRYEKFYTLLKDIGVTTLSFPADHYGLAMILGGAEGTLWDITGIYASMARTLNNYFERPGEKRYNRSDFHAPVYFQVKHLPETWEETSWLSASAIYLTFDALQEVNRPAEESGWQYFNSARRVAWKTGTSFGLRDGWAVGVTPDYAVGVWVGNADGEGRPGLTGGHTAAPIMFNIFSTLQGTRWFQPPYHEMEKVAVCRKSGYRLSGHCEEADTIWITKRGLEIPACPYHKMIHVTKDMKFRLHSECASLASMKHVNWFILPPVQEYYFKSRNISYRTVPPFRKDCQPSAPAFTMELIYPKANARIFIPRDIDGKPGSTVFQLAHRNPHAEVYWHLDGMYIGSTRRNHRMALDPPEGKHILTLVDEAGQILEEHFEVISKM